MKITDFFNNDYVNQASYDNLRKIASCIDGQKNAARKVLFTILEKNIKTEIKVSQLGSKVSEFAEYLHGNLDGVIVNLAQNFAGTNNLPLLVREGNFGNRFTPDASAPRYIFTHGSNSLFELFNKEDSNILIEQSFEGYRIEPRFYVPNLPILLINGSEGISSGFAQKVLPRNPKDIIKAVKSKVQGKKIPKLVPYFEGFNGVIEQGENELQWLVKGVIERIGLTKLLIKEVPVGYDLKSYIKVLDDLEEKGLINSYKDKSENDKFLFEITMNAKLLKDSTDEDLLVKFKLVKRITENLTCTDENNKIKIFNNIEEILDYYVEVKMKYLGKRKEYIISKIKSDSDIAKSKFKYITLVINDKIILKNRKKDDIIKDISKEKDIIQVNESYNYLINMPMHSVSKETLKELEDKVKELELKLKEIESETLEEMWLKDLENIKF